MKCKTCGAPVEENKCSYCGAFVPKDSIYSEKPVVAESGTSNTSDNKSSRTKTDNAEYMRMYIESQRKNKGVTLLLCILFGYCGAHYFYVGKIGMGLIYLFTFGLFGFGWIIDIFRIALGSFTDSKGLKVK